MRHSPRPVPLARGLLPALLLCAAAACSDALTTPAPPRATPRRGDVSGVTTLRPPTLIPNSRKYRDNGHKPATGRSGTVSLDVQALLGRDGQTEVRATSAVWGWYGPQPAGSITHLQVKGLTPNGTVLGTRVFGPELPGGSTATVNVGGLSRGSVVQVQGTVTGVDQSRTDVPSILMSVYLRPNLAVRELSVPARVAEGRPVPVTAVIAETHGDVGAWSECLLYVDGVARDYARTIWVDAGDAVTCLFSTSFLGEGKHAVEVRLGTGSPRDDDLGDNSASAQVEVFTTNELTYSAEVSGWEDSTYSWYRSSSVSADPVGSRNGYEYESEFFSWSRSQTFLFYGWTVKGMSEMPRLEFAEETNGATVRSATYQVAPQWQNGNQSCGQGWDDDAAVLVQICTGPGTYDGTSATYLRSTTRATYHSSGYSRTWDELTGDEMVYQYSYGGEGSQGLPLTLLGSDYTMRARLVAGDAEFHAATTFPIRVIESRQHYPYACYTYTGWWDGSTNQNCSVGDSHWVSTSGFGENPQ
jgi:hypothetical protein